MDNRVSETNREYELRSLEVGAALERYTDWLLQPFRAYLKGRVIEVGAGIGSISERYVDLADEVLLVEPAKNLCAELERRVVASRSHVRAVCGMLHEIIGT